MQLELVSGAWIPDSKAQDSGFWKLIFPDSRICIPLGWMTPGSRFPKVLITLKSNIQTKPKE